MKLISMQHAAGEGQNGLSPMPVGCDYPCGLKLHLQEQQLKALGIEMPKAGTKMRLEACAVVTRSSTEDPDADGDIDYVCVELQLTELGMEEDGEEDEEEEDPLEQRSRAAKTLYSPKE